MEHAAAVGEKLAAAEIRKKLSGLAGHAADHQIVLAIPVEVREGAIGEV